MYLRRLTEYLLKHRWQALILTFLLTFLPVIGVLSILLAALVTLCKGALEGALFTLVATIPYLLSVFYTPGLQEPGWMFLLLLTVGVAVISNVLTWVFAVMLNRQLSLSYILQVAALFSVLVVSILHLVFPDIAERWAEPLQLIFKQESMLPLVSRFRSHNEVELVSVIKQIATGLIIAAILFNAMLQVIAARWWQMTVFQPGGLRRELHGIRLSRLAMVLFLASFIISRFGNGVISDIMPILLLLFCAAGLSFAHYFLTYSTRYAWFWLAILYIALVLPITMPLVMGGLTMLAMIDAWRDLRHRLIRL